MSEERIKREIEIWENRVFYPDERFRDDTKADLEELKNILKDSSAGRFRCISSETESCVYKIGRFFIEKGVSNSHITFQDGEMIGAYIDTESKYDNKWRDLLNEYFDLYRKELANKWIFIPDLECWWNNKIAMYFLNKIRSIGALGLCFYSNKKEADTLAQILCQETYYKIDQFPKAVYKNIKKTKELEDDGY